MVQATQVLRMAAAGQRDALTEEAVRHINKQILDSYYIFKTSARETGNPAGGL
jgi:hypothetical protein